VPVVHFHESDKLCPKDISTPSLLKT